MAEVILPARQDRDGGIAVAENPPHHHHHHWGPAEFIAHLLGQRDQAHSHGLVASSPHRINNNNNSNYQNSRRHHPQESQSEHEGRRQEINIRGDPVATLFYDAEKKVTIAVLSNPTESLSLHFQRRVEQRTAVQRSILYYELDGFVRENFTSIQNTHYLKRPNCLRIAVGSLEASDQAQQFALEKQRKQVINALHQHTEQGIGYTLLEEVLEIARLHWLNDDLDALSVYCLAQASKTMNRLARRVVRHKMQQLSVAVTPFCDGCPLSGYSNFNRLLVSSTQNQVAVVRHLEPCGAAMEYQQCTPIQLVSDDNNENVNVPIGTFRPAHELRPNGGSDRNSNGDSTFGWMCEELALGNLHRWCSMEYAGQKLVVSCLLHPSDVVDHHTGVSLSSVHLEPNPHVGRRQWRQELTSLTVEILDSRMNQVDNLSLFYAGHARIHSVRINFMSLVKAVARRRLGHLVMEMDAIHQVRPLLDHERAYLHLVQKVAAH